MTESEQLAEARERISEFGMSTVRWKEIYPDATCFDEALEMCSFDSQMVEATEAAQERAEREAADYSETKRLAWEEYKRR